MLELVCWVRLGIGEIGVRLVLVDVCRQSPTADTRATHHTSHVTLSPEPRPHNPEPRISNPELQTLEPRTPNSDEL